MTLKLCWDEDSHDAPGVNGRLVTGTGVALLPRDLEPSSLSELASPLEGLEVVIITSQSAYEHYICEDYKVYMQKAWPCV